MSELDQLVNACLMPGFAGPAVPGWVEAALADGLAPARELGSVADVRTLGAVGVVQLRHPVEVAAVTRAALDAGVWVRPFRDLVYTMPPYVCTDDDLVRITSALVGAVQQVHG